MFIQEGITKGFKYLLLLLFTLIWGATVHAQNKMLEASVSKVNVAVGERFELVFKFTGKVRQFYAPNLSQFIRVSGPNQSSMPPHQEEV